MEDNGAKPYDSGKETSFTEAWILKELADSKSPETITDELLKKWDARELTVENKNIVGRFCLINGFLPSLLRVLKSDLRSGAPLPWSLVLEISLLTEKEIPLKKELLDAILTGAARDKQLHPLAAVALKNQVEGERWKKILDAELKDRLLEARSKREKLFKEMQIYKAEGMDEEVRLSLARILALFPNDPDASKLSQSMLEREMERNLDRFKIKRVITPRETLPEEAAWPELEQVIQNIESSLDLDQAYHFSIGLFQMGFHKRALSVLRAAKKNWSVREELWEIELLLTIGSFAEALGNTQIILNGHRTDDATVMAALYFSAKAYRGLGDAEQGTSILKALVQHNSHYRDSVILLREWEEAGQ